MSTDPAQTILFAGQKRYGQKSAVTRLHRVRIVLPALQDGGDKEAQDFSALVVVQKKISSIQTTFLGAPNLF